MPKVIYYDGHAPRETTYIYSRAPRRYGCMGFLGDILMTFLTGGLWLIWVFVREMRRR
jgi:hypothetical protein